MDLDILADDLRRVTVQVARRGNVVGAGVVWAPEWVVTNAHVIRHRSVEIGLADGRRAEGVVVAEDREADLALLRVPHLGIPGAAAAEPGRVRVGSLIVAIGHPFGMRGVLTRGIVHALGPVTPGGRSWIQGDLKLGPGNSGGPLADAQGHLLGLNAMVAGGLALAIPLGEVSRFVDAAGVCPA